MLSSLLLYAPDDGDLGNIYLMTWLTWIKFIAFLMAHGKFLFSYLVHYYLIFVQF